VTAVDLLACLVVMAVMWLMLPQYDRPPRRGAVDAHRLAAAADSPSARSIASLGASDEREAVAASGDGDSPLSRKRSPSRMRLERELQQYFDSIDLVREEGDSRDAAARKAG
jgi:hypothetical protein